MAIAEQHTLLNPCPRASSEDYVVDPILERVQRKLTIAQTDLHVGSHLRRWRY